MDTQVTSTDRLYSRRRLTGAMLTLLPGAGLLAAGDVKDTGRASMSTVTYLEVWKRSTCGCCKMWVKHLEKAGFTVKVNDVLETAPIRTKLRIPTELGSCHTGLIAGFAIEGHVPASDIRSLLMEPESLRQQVIGLSVPGMPIGSPGMEMGKKRDKFDVILVLKGGESRVYQSYKALA